LLVQALHQGLSPGYVEKLLSAFGPGMKITIHPPLEKKPENMGSLSERELEVLRLLESSMNTPEIARELYISVGTVRTHIKNIYCKLDVNRRMEAVRRARELGLI
jgi:LuxR family maltose regulon positive regulatory protein